MNNFADRLLDKISVKKNPCVVGLDPRLELFPEFILGPDNSGKNDGHIISAITAFNIYILDVVESLVPVIKPQIAFYEQYGIPGLIAFQNTIKAAKERGLIVIADAKRNDIGTTAEAYANAFLGKSQCWGNSKAIFDADAVTINPYLGYDTLMPFVNACKEYGKGVFVLVKTSNEGSSDIQNIVDSSNGQTIYSNVAGFVHKVGEETIGQHGYSSIGAVVGATYPKEALELRAIMKNNLFLVPGYGAQGASGKDITNCFNEDGLGAIINSSRGITFSGYDKTVSENEFKTIINNNTSNMIDDINAGLSI